VRNRDDANHFAKAMVSLKKYKDHINRDVMNLVDKTSPLGLRVEELQANLVSSSSHASKRKRNEELTRTMHLYDVEQSEIHSAIIAYKQERLRKAELDEEQEDQWRQEKERFEKHELNASQNVQPIDENNESVNWIKRLVLEISECIKRITQYISCMEEFIEKMENDRMQQRKTFLEQFQEDVVGILTSMFVKKDDGLEVEIGSKKASVNVENTAREINKVMQERFDSHEVFDQDEFMSDLRQGFAKILLGTVHSDLMDNSLDRDIDKVAAQFSEEVVKRQGDFYEIASYADKVQMKRVEWAKDLLIIARQEKSELVEWKVDASSISSAGFPLHQGQQRMERVTEKIQKIEELEKGVDFSREARTNKALEAFQNRKRMRSQPAANQPIFDQQPASNTFKPG